MWGRRAEFGGLLVHHLRNIAAHPEQYQPAQAEVLGSVALDLLAAAFAQYLDIEDTLSPEARHTTLRARVLDFIDRHLDSDELSPLSVAAAHHMSLRSLHRLFEGESTTVAELIRAKRLEQCRRDLANPLVRQPIQAIAARWGFRTRPTSVASSGLATDVPNRPIGRPSRTRAGDRSPSPVVSGIVLDEVTDGDADGLAVRVVR
ncbi:helix-turn-helix domain-containing protein [Micromonospora parva]|uniref:helix-turn-helix domain-containing protein n=1 Tax=Micromonospora parva TaxID=1464048 RepID=UPI0033D0AC32